jgi:hypothetical protein
MRISMRSRNARYSRVASDLVRRRDSVLIIR